MRKSLIAVALGVAVAGAAGGWLVANRMSPRHQVMSVAAPSADPAGAALESSIASVTPVVFHYEVTGMHCGGCAEAITAELMEVPGVQKVDCQYETHHAEIVVADASLQPKVEHAITKLGYTIAPSSK